MFSVFTAGFVLFLILSPWAWAASDTDELALLQKTSKAFTYIAKKAIPTVVFIKVEKTIQTGQQLSPYQFNNPFDLFSDEFFERFFGHRYPQLRKPRQYKQMGWGSGFIISKQGYILTNNHVVGDADKITVQLANGREFEAKIIGTDPSSDVALIKIKGSEDLPVLPLGDSDKLEVGEWVMAIGNPFGLSHTMTVGVVSAKGRTSVGISDYEDFIQTDAAINPGNSGGPLINMKGEAVGINTAIFSKSGGYMGIGFAIPINMVKAIKKQLIAYGKVSRGYLGVYLQELSKDLIESFNLKDIKGVLVVDVTEGSPADRAGIRRGDVVVEMNGKRVEDVGHFRNMVALSEPGSKARIVVIRNGKRIEIEVTLGSQEKAVARATRTDLMERLGFTVQDLTRELAEQLGYELKEGVVISQVVPGTPAQLAGLRPGMLILEVNRKEVKNTRQFLEALEISRRTESVLLLVQYGQYTQYVVLKL
ncbi:MAG: DegQ family serine endoprotease [Deltaproteobacteria bacterium]|nr:DegQ family serine endoprotease [Deltaproteobacteria bacterium]MBW1961372.1 DegQ family serine endoprotease [Deltaproteobacteria bacterium]MBW2152532.1 DegQ family serine endoprotease [Deltaproteobacteria bacterium]